MERHLGDWDQNMQCYPHISECDGRTFLLYNGNEFGRFGFGAAGSYIVNSEVSILKNTASGELLSTVLAHLRRVISTRVEHASIDRRLRPKADR